MGVPRSDADVAAWEPKQGANSAQECREIGAQLLLSTPVAHQLEVLQKFVFAEYHLPGSPPYSLKDAVAAMNALHPLLLRGKIAANKERCVFTGDSYAIQSKYKKSGGIYSDTSLYMAVGDLLRDSAMVELKQGNTSAALDDLEAAASLAHQTSGTFERDLTLVGGGFSSMVADSADQIVQASAGNRKVTERIAKIVGLLPPVHTMKENLAREIPWRMELFEDAKKDPDFGEFLKKGYRYLPEFYKKPQMLDLARAQVLHDWRKVFESLPEHDDVAAFNKALQHAEDAFSRQWPANAIMDSPFNFYKANKMAAQWAADERTKRLRLQNR